MISIQDRVLSRLICTDRAGIFVSFLLIFPRGVIYNVSRSPSYRLHVSLSVSYRLPHFLANSLPRQDALTTLCLLKHALAIPHSLPPRTSQRNYSTDLLEAEHRDQFRNAQALLVKGSTRRPEAVASGTESSAAPARSSPKQGVPSGVAGFRAAADEVKNFRSGFRQRMVGFMEALKNDVEALADDVRIFYCNCYLRTLNIPTTNKMYFGTNRKPQLILFFFSLHLCPPLLGPQTAPVFFNPTSLCFVCSQADEDTLQKLAKMREDLDSRIKSEKSKDRQSDNSPSKTKKAIRFNERDLKTLYSLETDGTGALANALSSSRSTASSQGGPVSSRAAPIASFLERSRLEQRRRDYEAFLAAKETEYVAARGPGSSSSPPRSDGSGGQSPTHSSSSSCEPSCEPSLPPRLNQADEELKQERLRLMEAEYVARLEAEARERRAQAEEEARAREALEQRRRAAQAERDRLDCEARARDEEMARLQERLVSDERSEREGLASQLAEQPQELPRQQPLREPEQEFEPEFEPEPEAAAEPLGEEVKEGAGPAFEAAPYQLSARRQGPVQPQPLPGAYEPAHQVPASMRARREAGPKKMSFSVTENLIAKPVDTPAMRAKVKAIISSNPPRK
jgi:hypothetical protein